MVLAAFGAPGLLNTSSRGTPRFGRNQDKLSVVAVKPTLKSLLTGPESAGKGAEADPAAHKPAHSLKNKAPARGLLLGGKTLAVTGIGATGFEPAT